MAEKYQQLLETFLESINNWRRGGNKECFEVEKIGLQMKMPTLITDVQCFYDFEGKNFN